MQIIYLCDIDLNAFLGGTRHVLEVVQNMGRLGHKVRLYAPRYTRPTPHIAYENVHAIFIPTVNARIMSWIIFYILLPFYLLMDLLSEGRPDLVYSREMVFNVLLPFFCKINRIPLIIEVNAIITEELEMVGKGKLELGLARFCQRINFRRARGIIAVTQMIKRAIQERCNIAVPKVAVVSNGTDKEHFRPIPEGEARERVGLEKERRYIGFVGSCYHYHDILTLIRSAPLVLQKYPGVRFVIVGDGIAKKGWEDMVKKNGLATSFLFTGYRPYDIIPYYINAFDICVAPFTIKRNKTTGLSPMKLLDYLACGKAVIGTEIGEVGSVLKEFRAGIVIPPENPQGLANAIIDLLENPSLCKEIGLRGRKLIVEKFTWIKKVKEIMNFVERLLCERQTR